MVAIQRLKDHPIDFNEIGWKDKVIGRKLWWRGQPGIVTKWVDGQACIIIEPDGIDRFKIPEKFRDDDSPIYEGEDIKADIFSGHIYWFRE